MMPFNPYTRDTVIWVLGEGSGNLPGLIALFGRELEGRSRMLEPLFLHFSYWLFCSSLDRDNIMLIMGLL